MKDQVARRSVLEVTEEGSTKTTSVNYWEIVVDIICNYERGSACVCGWCDCVGQKYCQPRK